MTVEGRRRPRNRAQRTLRRPSPERYGTRRVTFDSEGGACVGTLYEPDRPRNAPVVVMAPGAGMRRSFGLPAVAERFAEAGYAAFPFDYRGFGDSEGEPRNLVSPSRQIADLNAAVDRVRRMDDVGGGGVVLWGFSLGGGHALSVAADDRRVAAVVALSPVTDGRKLVRSRGVGFAAKSLAVGLRDAVGARVGSGASVPLAGEGGELALLSQPGAKRSFVDLADRESDWTNETPARSLLGFPRYRPVKRCEEIDCPAFLFAGTDDDVVDAAWVEAAADEIDGSTFVRAPVGHFDSLADRFELATHYQLAFLDDRFEGETRDSAAVAGGVRDRKGRRR